MKRDSSWENSAQWYDKIVGEKGHYYHKQVIVPRVRKLMKGAGNILDLACGQGVMARELKGYKNYVGIDLSPALILSAEKTIPEEKCTFHVADVTKPLPVKENHFDTILIILALQNIADPEKVIKNCSLHLKKGGQLIIVLNHPCFRIPRQSRWLIDQQKKLQSRVLDRYISSMEVPIQTHPGKKESVTTISYHYPLGSYTSWLKNCGFVITDIEELCSDKKSTGSMAKMEDRARKEFPLFLTLVAKKI